MVNSSYVHIPYTVNDSLNPSRQFPGVYAHRRGEAIHSYATPLDVRPAEGFGLVSGCEYAGILHSEYIERTWGDEVFHSYIAAGLPVDVEESPESGASPVYVHRNGCRLLHGTIYTGGTLPSLGSEYEEPRGFHGARDSGCTYIGETRTHARLRAYRNLHECGRASPQRGFPVTRDSGCIYTEEARGSCASSGVRTP